MNEEIIYWSKRLIIPHVFDNKYLIKVETPQFLNSFLTSNIPKKFKRDFKSGKDTFPYDFESDMVKIFIGLKKISYEVKFTLEKENRMAEIILIINPIEGLEDLKILLLDGNNGEIRQII